MGFSDRLRRAASAFASDPPPEAVATETPPGGRSFSLDQLPTGVGLEQFFPFWMGEHQGLVAIDDLIARRGIDELRAMEEKDDMVRAASLLLILGRLSTDWKLHHASDDPRDLEIADCVKFILGDLDGTSVTRMLDDVLDSLRVGFAVINRVKRGIYPPGHPWAGKRGIRTFRPLPQETLTFKLDEWGEIEPKGVWQAVPHVVVSSTDPAHFNHLDRERMIIWSWQRRSGHPLGKSLFRPAYRWYFLKGQAFPWMGGYVETYGWPATMGEVPANTSEAVKRQVLEDLRKFQTHRRMVYPAGTKITFQERTSTATMDIYTAIFNLCNRGIARALLNPATLIDQPEVGAYSLGESQRGTFELVLTNIGRYLRDEVMGPQVIRPLVRENFGEVYELPKWEFEPFSEGDKVALATMYKILVDAGLPLSPKQIYEATSTKPPEEGEEPVGATSSASTDPPLPSQGMPGMEGDKGLDDLLADLTRANGHHEEVMRVIRGKGRRSGSRARDLWQ